MQRIALACLVWASCAPGQTLAPNVPAASRPVCDQGQVFSESTCRDPGPGKAALERGLVALGEFRVDDALRELERARQEGPHTRADYVRVFEGLGIAYAYLGDEERALDAFDMLLDLDADHLLSYTLSPKVTFVFERARKRSLERARPELHVSWPYELEVTRPMPIDLEVVADPKDFLHQARLIMRRKGTDGFSALDIELPAPGQHKRVILPALGGERPDVLELYVSARDERDNQVLLWASPERPREIALGYTPPTRWYKKWWVWTAVGTLVAAGTGTAVYALTREPPETVGGTLLFGR